MSSISRAMVLPAIACLIVATSPATAQEKAGATAATQDKSGEYRLHAGDSITVSVWKELDLQRKVMIRPDGRFSFPLAGEVQAAGRTADEVRVEIENSLKKFIPEAVVTVIIEDFSGNRVYVIGQVNKPGMFIMNPSLTVLQALSLAGGSTPFAKLDGISIVRGSGAAQKTLPFRYSQVVEGKSLQQNITLDSGDVIVVP
jgi:polysaccharide export outer membrane protein